MTRVAPRVGLAAFFAACRVATRQSAASHITGSTTRAGSRIRTTLVPHVEVVTNCCNP